MLWWVFTKVLSPALRRSHSLPALDPWTALCARGGAGTQREVHVYYPSAYNLLLEFNHKGRQIRIPPCQTWWWHHEYVCVGERDEIFDKKDRVSGQTKKIKKHSYSNLLKEIHNPTVSRLVCKLLEVSPAPTSLIPTPPRNWDNMTPLERSFSNSWNLSESF